MAGELAGEKNKNSGPAPLQGGKKETQMSRIVGSRIVAIAVLSLYVCLMTACEAPVKQDIAPKQVAAEAKPAIGLATEHLTSLRIGKFNLISPVVT